MAAAVPRGEVPSVSLVPAGHLTSEGGQRRSAWAQPFPLRDFRSPSLVDQSSSVQAGERLELVGCFSANHLLGGVCGQTVLALSSPW